MSELFGKYGLPLEVKFCKKCTVNNQRPSSAIEFKQKKTDKKEFIHFEDDICEACRYLEKKANIDWKEREKELIDLCNKYRKNDGHFDCIVPGSGGKDSLLAAHILKYKYNMNPLTVTWPPNMYTDIGQHNFDAWLNSGLTNYKYSPNQQVHKKLTQLAFKELVHPFQPFILGQKNVAPKLSTIMNIPLVFYGEHEAEYGNAQEQNDSPVRDKKYFSAQEEIKNIFLSGYRVEDLMREYGWRLSDIDAYLPANPYALEKTKTEIHYLGYYIKWHPQEVYYYSVENTDFQPNFRRTEGSYSKYCSLDDKIDWLHWYTYHTKFGIGRATNDSAQEIRNGDITRAEGIALVKRFDGEYPKIYLNDILNYLKVSKEEFDEIINNARPNHLWNKVNNEWKLKQPIWKEREKNA
jgi:N-acetyl sugar amidotransferase